MYGEHERPTTKRIIFTSASIVGAIVVALLLVWLAFQWAAPHYTPAPVPEAVKPAVTQSATAPAPTTATPSHAETVSATLPAAGSVAPAPKAAAAPAAAAPVAQSGLGTVVIDAGHQGTQDSRLEPIGPGSSTKKPSVESGTEGVVTKAPESEVNLEVALKLQKALEARGVRVVMVRTSQNVDIPNSQRAKIANDNHAALFVRLHCDGVDNSSTHGLLMLRPGANQWTGPIVAPSKAAAEDVDKAVLAATGAYDRGTTPRNDLSGFNWSKVPTILVEMGVMSNPAEDRKLSSTEYQQQLADGMATGIVEYLKSR